MVNRLFSADIFPSVKAPLPRPIFLCLLLSIFLNAASGVFPKHLLASGNQDSQADEKIQLFGVIKLPQQHLRTLIQLERSGETWTGISKSIDQNNAEIPISAASFKEGQWTIEFDSVGAKFEGEENPEGIIAGTFTQNGIELPLQLERIEAIPVDRPDRILGGQCDAVVRKLDFQFRLYETSGEPSDATIPQAAGLAYFDSLSEGLTSIVATFERKDDRVRIAMPAIGASFEGIIQENGESIKGKFKQNGVALDLVVESADSVASVDTKPNRPQTPTGNTPYQSIDFEVENSDAIDVTLAGTMTIPAGDGPFPAVILVSGSGPQDRNETIFDHQPFAVIADHLSRNGIAVFRFDDRGVAESTGNFSTATSDDFASDVEAIFDFAASQETIDADQIGIIGHSEGGLIGPMVAAANASVAHVIMLAGPGVDGATTLMLQSKRILELSGVDEEAIKKDQAMRVQIHEIATSDQPLEQKKTKLREVLAAIADANSTQAEIDGLATQFEALFSPWMQRFLAYDPIPTIVQVDCPILGLWASKDCQVLAQENLQPIQEALQSNGKTNASLRILDGLNHLFQPAETGLINEYGSIETTIAPEVLDQILKFVQRVSMAK